MPRKMHRGKKGSGKNKTVRNLVRLKKKMKANKMKRLAAAGKEKK